MPPAHASLIAIVAASLAAAVALVENYAYRGVLVRWLLLTIVFSVAGFIVLRKRP